MNRAADEMSRAALKTATKRLIRELGGQEAAASVTRVGASKLNEYGAAHIAMHMPVDVVLDLETCLGRPIVTAELARVQRCLLLPMELGDGDVAQALSAVARDCGKTLSDAMRALGEGLGGAETTVLMRDLCELAAAVNATIAILAGRDSAVRGVKDG